MRRVLTCMMTNNPGVLNRFTGALNRRQVNIDSISISPVVDPAVSRVTMAVYLADKAASTQLLRQLEKQVDVFEVKDITDVPHIERELVLIKISALPEKRAELLAMIQPFRAAIVDVSSVDVVVQITGTRSKVAALLRVVKPYGILKLVRTGVAGFPRAESTSD
ncbi:MULTISPECIES: acetolactate synthase small subunit [Loigolactobacillus]|uniref:Acetolactate synthase small subunit n=1 Tax=Loigolactobacillus backii TaxID=375175 RepID=A0A192H015_9LACO|nr:MULTISPECIES: acetolactate synthase small subunit [Loigolactobacillus]ANK60838.1 acetolactate synthase small subunit [Loigolactobacillus backii]ANK61587.1 acetolactate synthase small subunit [Loigolactobacillus backii]ANK65791.1 acetolactate synthase small subunit [Loigolactobacillus backii]ANK68268.1 acetolactate synthase small subunit [Loigolactobacillus backii]ANK69215.1 acetolactate synthase small subunit [Loigolactobacillus backii]